MIGSSQRACLKHLLPLAWIRVLIGQDASWRSNEILLNIVLCFDSFAFHTQVKLTYLFSAWRGRIATRNHFDGTKSRCLLLTVFLGTNTDAAN